MFLAACQPATDTNRNLAAASSTPAKETFDPAAIEAELVKLERDWAAAAKNHDAEAVRRIVADDAVMVFDQTKQQIEHLRSDGDELGASLEFAPVGIERSDLALISRGLADRLHQPHRAHLYPRSMELLAEAQDVGAIGATISERSGPASAPPAVATAALAPNTLFWASNAASNAVARTVRWRRFCKSSLLRPVSPPIDQHA